MREGLKGADIVMMLRLQRERMNGSFVPSTQEYFHYFGLDQKKLAYAKPDALVMHPGPMNRGVEIDSAVADGAQSLIREQVEMGVAVRMAVLEALCPRDMLPNAWIDHMPAQIETMSRKKGACIVYDRLGRCRRILFRRLLGVGNPRRLHALARFLADRLWRVLRR